MHKTKILPALLLLTSIAGHTQTVPAAPAFDAAYVRISPHRNFPAWNGGTLRGDRFTLHQATMVDLITNAYGVEPENVQGGPSWLEMDRFDITAKAPPKTPPDTVKLMLQALLAERFHLKLHTGSNPLAAYVLSAGPGKPILKESDGTGDSGCRDTGSPQNPSVMLSCHNVTMDAFAREIHQQANGYLEQPVVNATNLKGSYDFDLTWTRHYLLDQQGASAVTVFDAIAKQLGLKLALETAPRPVLVVDSVSDAPTPNIAGIEKVLPSTPPAQFEVATIKPSKPETQLNLRLNGDQVNLEGFPLKLIIQFAYQLNPNDPEVLVNAPKGLDDDHYDILAKIPAEIIANARNPRQIDADDIDSMMQRLLIDRFQLKAHFEDRPVNAYALTAITPKLTKADPLSRTRCKEGPGPDGKDPRIANKVLDRLLTCQNMTTAQISEELQHVAAGYIFGPVVDETGLQGGWNFTLSFSSIGALRAAEKGGANPTAGNDTTATDPSGAISLFDAVRRQLGLKLDKQKRPGPVLVIDSIQEKPTEN